MQFFSFLILVLPTIILSEPISLTDKTWKDMLCGQWMVEFYAPWCPSCQYFQPTWDDFAKAMVSKEVKVAAVDINDYPSLSGRFRISVLPTIYYVRDGVFRQYNGERSLDALKSYIEFQEWQRTEPVSSLIAPDSFPMSLISSIFDISVLVKDAYTLLQEKYGWPSWLIYIFFTAVIIVVGLVLGFGVLILIDYCVTGPVKDDLNNLPDDSKDAEDLEDTESQKLLKTKKPMNSVPKSLTSSTPQRKTNTNISQSVPYDEILPDENDDSEGLNTSDLAQATDEEEQPLEPSVRHRHVKK